MIVDIMQNVMKFQQTWKDPFENHFLISQILSGAVLYFKKFNKPTDFHSSRHV